MAWEPATHALWVSVNERDELGSDLVPDYMTAVHDGAFYGFPYSYYGRNVDTRVKTQRPDGFELWVFQRNGPALAFYHARGFRETLRTDGSANEEHEPDALFEWARPG